MQTQHVHVRYLNELLLWALAAVAVLIMAVAVRSTPSNRLVHLERFRNRWLPRLHPRTAAARSPIS